MESATFQDIDPVKLAQVVEILDSTVNPQNKDHCAILERYSEYKKSPDLLNYLFYVIQEMNDQRNPYNIANIFELKIAAFLTLKSYITDHFSELNDQLKDYLIFQCIEMFSRFPVTFRSIIGLTLLEIANNNIRSREVISQHVIGLVKNSSDPDYYKTAMQVIIGVCQDITLKQNEKLDSLVLFCAGVAPSLIDFFSHDCPFIRCNAVSCISMFIPSATSVIFSPDLNFLNKLEILINDPSDEVKEKLCICFKAIAEIDIFFIPYIDKVVAFLLECCSVESYSVRKSASEFWQYLSRNSNSQSILDNVKTCLIPALVRNMVYSDQDFETLIVREEEIEIQNEKEDTVNPSVDTSRKNGMIGVFSCETETDSCDYDYDNDQNDSTSSLGAFDELDDGVTSWTLRKSSACCLDFLSSTLKNSMLPIILPIIQETLQSPDWLIVESGILAVGAIASGCYQPMLEFFPQLTTYFFNCLKHEKALVRSITCWTLDRYAGYFLIQGHDLLLQQFICGIITCCVDKSAHVQSFAFSTLASLADKAGSCLIPFADEIFKYIFASVPKFKKRTICAFYEFISALCDHAPEISSTWSFRELVVKFVVGNFLKYPKNGNTFSYLVTCLSQITRCSKESIQVHIPDLVHACTGLIEQTVSQEIAALQEPELVTSPDLVFLTSSMDLLSALVVVYREAVIPSMIKENTAANIVYSFQIQGNYIKEYLFPLLADIACHCPVLIKEIIPTLVDLALESMQAGFRGSCEDASWFCCQALLICEPTNVAFQKILELSISWINSPNTRRPLQSLSVILISRLGQHFLVEVSQFIDAFFFSWCKIMSNMFDSSEKEESIFFMVSVVKINPSLHVKKFVDLMRAFSSFNKVSTKLKSLLIEYLNLSQPLLQETGLLGADLLQLLPQDVSFSIQTVYFAQESL